MHALNYGGLAGGEALAPRVGPDDLVAARADADQRDRDADEVGDVRQVVARGLRQVALIAHAGDVLVPAGQLLVLAGCLVHHGLVVRVVVEARLLGAAVVRADVERAEAGQNVELRDRQVRERVDAGRVAQGDEVDPTDAAGAAGGPPVLPPRLSQRDPELVVELGRERARADARGVGLRDAPDLVDVLRPDAGAGAGGRGHRVGG